MRARVYPAPARGARVARAVAFATALLLVLCAAGTAGAQQVSEPDSPVQILTADLARVQTVETDRIAATFLIVGQRPLREFRVNNEVEPIESDTVVVVNRELPLPDEENLIQVVAIDVAGNRREKTFLVIRKPAAVAPAPQSRRERIVELMQAGKYLEARVEVDLWAQQGGPAAVLNPLRRQIDAQYTIAQSRIVLEQIDGRKYDEALRTLNSWRIAGGDEITIAGLRQQVLQNKRTLLRGQIEAAILGGKLDEADALLSEWESAGDSKEMVANLRKIWTEWKDAPRFSVDLRGIPKRTVVRLQRRSMGSSVADWAPSDPQLRERETRLLGSGPGRYELPGPGAYTLNLVDEKPTTPLLHDPWLHAFSTDRAAPAQVIEPALPYAVQGRWEKGKAMPTPRAAPGVLARDGQILVVTGYVNERYVRDPGQRSFQPPRDESQYAQTFDAYDAYAATWQGSAVVVDSPPEPRSLYTPVAIGDEVYFVSAKGSVWRYRLEQPQPGQWRFGTQGLPWSQTKLELVEMQERPPAVGVGGAIFVVGGGLLNTSPSVSADVVPLPSDALRRFDPATRELTQLQAVPRARYGSANAVVDGRIYVFGGREGNAILGGAYRYRPDANRWDLLASMPTPRTGAVAAVVNGDIWVIGGETGGTFGDKVVATVEIYDPRTDRWRPGPPMPTARKNAGAVVIDGDIYVLGGSDGDPVSAVEILR